MASCVPEPGLCDGDPPHCPLSLARSFGNLLVNPATIQTAVGFIFASVLREFIKSLVSDIIMPPIGAALGQRDFSQLFIQINRPKHQTVAHLAAAGLVYPGQFKTVKEAEEAGIDTTITVNSIAEAERVGAATWNYGLFINNLINVLMTAFSLAIFLYVVNNVRYWRYKRTCSS